MKYLLILVSTFSFLTINAQNHARVELMDQLHGDNFYNVNIDNQPATSMYLHFSEPDHPSFGHIYIKYSTVLGWYINEKQEKISLTGVLWAQDKLTLYACDKKYKANSLKLEYLDYDSVKIYELTNPKVTLPISEKFMISNKEGIWSKDGKTKTVKGINFQHNSLDRELLLSIKDEHDDSHFINLQSLIITKLATTKNALVGMNGWAETEFELVEHTFNEKGVNVLIRIMEQGSCNTDRTSLMYVCINKNYIIADYGI